MSIKCLIITSFLFLSCATQVKNINDLEKYKDEGISYVIFSYNPSDDYSIELEVKDIEKDRSFKFDLASPDPNALEFFIGPFVVYRKALEKYDTTESSPLTFVPLPVGKYICHYLRYNEKPSKNVFRNLAGIKPVSLSWISTKDTFEIKADKPTYIGSYEGTTKYTLKLPSDVDIQVSDQLKVRTKQMDLSEDMNKYICRIK